MRVAPERLPHWSRVAFAARCARRVQPLFSAAWPEVTAEKAGEVEQAISLAERSAADGRPFDGLREAMVAAIGVAGRALIPHHYPVTMEDGEQPPADPDAALVASFAAKVAEKAAEAALAPPGSSGRPAAEAFHFAVDAIEAAGRPGLIEVLEADFETAASRSSRRPWWRFW